MSSISSISGTYPAAYSRPAVEGSYETNARAFGPMVASAIGAAEAGTTAASAIVSFSSESLHQLGDAIESGYDAVKNGVGSMASGISQLAHDGVDAVEGAYDEVADAVGSVAGSVGHAAGSISDGVGSALGTVGQYAALGMAAGRQLISEIA